jgi:hypothetical protein
VTILRLESVVIKEHHTLGKTSCLSISYNLPFARFLIMTETGKKEFFLLVGTFDGAPHSVREQIVNPRILGAASHGLRAIQ